MGLLTWNIAITLTHSFLSTCPSVHCCKIHLLQSQFFIFLSNFQPRKSYLSLTKEIQMPSPGGSDLTRYGLQKPFSLNKVDILIFAANTLKVLDCLSQAISLSSSKGKERGKFKNKQTNKPFPIHKKRACSQTLGRHS